MVFGFPKKSSSQRPISIPIKSQKNTKNITILKIKKTRYILYDRQKSKTGYRKMEQR